MQSMECPCEQFASLLENKIKNKMNVVQMDQKIMAMTNLHFNQEFLFLLVSDMVVCKNTVCNFIQHLKALLLGKMLVCTQDTVALYCKSHNC